MKKKFLPLFFLSLSVFIFSCGNSGKSELKKSGDSGTVEAVKDDTLSNELQCNIVIDGKDFSIPADSITTAYANRDSSFKITVKGINGGWVVLDIPNLFKCPCKIPTGYSSVYRKIYETEEYEVVPTVELYSYPLAGISFRNLNDGFHKKDVTDNAAEVIAVQKTNENTSTRWAEYLIKGKIHTTVLKNVYESAAGDKNKDYTVNGKFVIKTRIDY